MTILVTGGAGYIGSHTCVELIQAGFDVLVVDNFVNSKVESLKRVAEITGKEVPWVQADIRDRDALRSIFNAHKISAVIHFAGLKAVGESSQIPLHYYENNIAGTLNLCHVMDDHKVRNIVFSSSATVYGDPATTPITEDFPTSATNPYGRSKLMVEEILHDVCAMPNTQWRASILRYFNPIGAHDSGRIGEDPQGIPNNLLPFVAQVAVGKLDKLCVFGNDYPTVDGTGVRDYIHVVDLAKGHVKAIETLLSSSAGAYTYNLGTGKGYSVLEVVKAFEKASNTTVPYDIVPRRSGDIATCYADPEKALAELGWKAEYGLEQMVTDAWHWQSHNPKGYDE